MAPAARVGQPPRALSRLPVPVLRLGSARDSRSSRRTKTRGRRSNAADFCTSCGSSSSPNGSGAATGASKPSDLAEARALFEEMCERALARRFPPPRPHSNATGCSGRRSVRASRTACSRWRRSGRPRIVERLLEFPLQGDFTFRTRDGETRTVTLSAKTDRIDLLADGTLRVIDYKSKKTPDPETGAAAADLQLLSRASRCARARGADLDDRRGDVPLVRRRQGSGAAARERPHDSMSCWTTRRSG